VAGVHPLRIAVEVDTSQAERALTALARRFADIGAPRPSIVSIAATAAVASATTRPISRRSLLGLAGKRA